MKKRLLAILLLCIMVLSLLPMGLLTGVKAAVTTLTPDEALSQLGLKFSTTSVDLGSMTQESAYNYIGGKKSFSIENNGKEHIYIDVTSAAGTGTKMDHGTFRLVAIDRFATVWFDIRLHDLPGTHSETLLLKVLEGNELYKTHIATIELPVQWTIVSDSDVAADENISVTPAELDFGAVDIENSAPHSLPVTITNTGLFDLRIVGSTITDNPYYRFRMDYSQNSLMLAPGESGQMTVICEGAERATGAVEDAWLQLKVFHNKHNNNPVQTIKVPLHAILQKGVGFPISNRANKTYGSIAGPDGQYFQLSYTVPAGESATFQFRPYGKNHVLNVYLDGACLGPLDSYTFTNVQAPHSLDADFAPGPAPSSWAFKDVSAAFALKLVDPDMFRQDWGSQVSSMNYPSAITRAEFCTLAAKLYKVSTGDLYRDPVLPESTFSDLSSAFYHKNDILLMAELEVVNGIGNGHFNPTGTLTREQAATMLARLAEQLGHPFPSAETAFSDRGQISTWAVSAVGQVQAGGIMGGVGNNTFSPKGSYSREQSVVTMLRLYQSLSN